MILMFGVPVSSRLCPEVLGMIRRDARGQLCDWPAKGWAREGVNVVEVDHTFGRPTVHLGREFELRYESSLGLVSSSTRSTPRAPVGRFTASDILRKVRFEVDNAG